VMPSAKEGTPDKHENSKDQEVQSDQGFR
jgi:hypothetical protein